MMSVQWLNLCDGADALLLTLHQEAAFPQLWT